MMARNVAIFALVALIATPSVLVHTSLYQNFLSRGTITAQSVEPVLPVNRISEPVPFLIYDGPAVRKILEACRGVEQWRTNHGTEHAFLMAMRTHPWRTERAEEALVFVVPMYFSSMYRKQCKGSMSKLYESLVEEVEATWYFQRFQGMDHMTMDTDWVGPHNMARVAPVLVPMIRNFIWGAYQEKEPKRGEWRCSVQVPTIPSATHEALYRVRRDWFSKTGFEQWSARPYNIMFQGDTTIEKKSHRNRRQAILDLPQHFSPSVLVSNTDPKHYQACEATNLEGCQQDNDMTAYLERLWNSKFGLHFRGDDPHGFRFYDILAGGEIAIVISTGFRETVLPFQCEIPWDDFVIFVDAEEYTENPVQTIKNALDSVDDNWVKNALRQQMRYEPQYLWELDPRRVSENALRSAVRKCFTDGMLKRVDLERSDFPCLYPDLVQSLDGSMTFRPNLPATTKPKTRRLLESLQLRAQRIPVHEATDS